MPQLDKVIILDQVVSVCVILVIFHFLINIFLLPNLFVSLSYRAAKLLSLSQAYWSYMNKAGNTNFVNSKLLFSFFSSSSVFLASFKSFLNGRVLPFIFLISYYLEFYSVSFLFPRLFLNRVLKNESLAGNNTSISSNNKFSIFFK